jgi:hypothetical protein
MRALGFLLVTIWHPLLAQTPENFKIAFIGDQGMGEDAVAVLNLIKNEGADAVLHQGDFDYDDDPASWDAQINSILGPDFPYFGCAGNHDEDAWEGAGGYQEFLATRLNRLGISWDGDLGTKSSLSYKGIFMVLVAPDVFGSGHADYIRQQLAEDNSIWRICSWHKNMEAMQVGGKSDETGWEVYEEATNGGAIIATAHEHSYSRTHLLSNIRNQTVVSSSDNLTITRGETFVFVSGLGGRSIREQERSGAYWASIYTSNQDANFGALFGIFNVNGVANRAEFYFKDIHGTIVDRFNVISEVSGGSNGQDEDEGEGIPTSVVPEFDLEQNYPNPFNPTTTIRFRLSEAGPVKLTIFNLQGHRVRTLFEGGMPADQPMTIQWDARNDAGELVPSGTYYYRLEFNGQTQTKGLVFMR